MKFISLNFLADFNSPTFLRLLNEMNIFVEINWMIRLVRFLL